LGILIGISIVTILVAYGGVGVNLLLAVYRDEVPHESLLLYRIVVWYFLGVVLLLLIAGVLTLAEFVDWKIKNKKGLIYTTLSLLLVLVIVHLAMFLGVGGVSDQEVKSLFVDGAVPYAVLTIVVVGLFIVLHRIRRAP
jgi:heme/copper-type cytochrome/quinol oxidase subunit 4